MIITSLQNPSIKKIIELRAKASKRKNENLCVVEGWIEIDIAIQSGFIPVGFYFEKEDENRFLNKYNNRFQNIAYFVNSIITEKIATRKGEIIGLFECKNQSEQELQLPENPFVLILENIEKPGNLGSLFRTSDAAGVDLIICTEMQTDIYNPNVIRNSLGTVFSNQIITMTNEEAHAFCKRNQINIVTTYLHTSKNYYHINMQNSVSIVMGNEHSGISNFWIENSDELVKIPMNGAIDSMNISNAAAIMMYEVVRQRSI